MSRKIINLNNYRCDGQMSIFDLIEQPLSIREIGIGTLFRYLRYGPHTVIPVVASRCKAYLDSQGGNLPVDFIEVYGNPKQWKLLPCANCEYGRSGTCRAGGHTCHYEYGVLICDAFRQTFNGGCHDRKISRR